MTAPSSPTSLQAIQFPYSAFTFVTRSGFFGPEVNGEVVDEGDPLPIRLQKMYNLSHLFPQTAELVQEGWQNTQVADIFQRWTNPFSFEYGETNEFALPVVDKTDQVILRIAYYLGDLISNHYPVKVASNAWDEICAIQQTPDLRYSLTFRPLCLMTRKVHQTLLKEWRQLLSDAYEAYTELNTTIAENTVPLINTNPSMYTSMDLLKLMDVNIQQETLSRAKAQQFLLKYLLLAVQHQQEISYQALQETLVKNFFPTETSLDIWFRPFNEEDNVSCLDNPDYILVPKPHPLAPKPEVDHSLIPFTEIFPDRMNLSKEGWEKTEVSDSFQGWGCRYFMEGELRDHYNLPFFTHYEALIHDLDSYLREIVTNRWLSKVLLEAFRQMTSDPGTPGLKVPVYRCTEPFRVLFLLARKNHQICIARYQTLKGEIKRILDEFDNPSLVDDEAAQRRGVTVKAYIKSLLTAIQTQQNLETYALSALSSALTGEPFLDEGWLMASKSTVETMDSYLKSSDLLPVGAKFWDSFETFLIKDGYQVKGTPSIAPYTY